jgi:hypothetical protein
MTSIPRTVPIGFIFRIAPLVLRNTSPIGCRNRHLRPKPAVSRRALTPLLPIGVVGRCCTLLPLASTRHPLQPPRKLRCSRHMLLVRVIVRCSLCCRSNIRVFALIRVHSNPPLRLTVPRFARAFSRLPSSSMRPTRTIELSSPR